MTGANKILTVSYGTFSCTLEGFDEPFEAMRAIAEYFRDLAAEDRFFGAEPPVPDAEMLARIAEAKARGPVEARVRDTGVDLRLAPAAPAAEPPRPTPRPEPVAFAEPVEEPLSSEVVESVAEKLKRIRAAVAESRVAPAPAVAVAAVMAEPLAPEAAEEKLEAAPFLSEPARAPEAAEPAAGAEMAEVAADAEDVSAGASDNDHAVEDPTDMAPEADADEAPVEVAEEEAGPASDGESREEPEAALFAETVEIDAGPVLAEPAPVDAATTEPEVEAHAVDVAPEEVEAPEPEVDSHAEEPAPEEVAEPVAALEAVAEEEQAEAAAPDAAPDAAAMDEVAEEGTEASGWADAAEVEAADPQDEAATAPEIEPAQAAAAPQPEDDAEAIIARIAALKAEVLAAATPPAPEADPWRDAAEAVEDEGSDEAAEAPEPLSADARFADPESGTEAEGTDWDDADEAEAAEWAVTEAEVDDAAIGTAEAEEAGEVDELRAEDGTAEAGWSWADDSATESAEATEAEDANAAHEATDHTDEAIVTMEPEAVAAEDAGAEPLPRLADEEAEAEAGEPMAAEAAEEEATPPTAEDTLPEPVLFDATPVRPMSLLQRARARFFGGFGRGTADAAPKSEEPLPVLVLGPETAEEPAPSEAATLRIAAEAAVAIAAAEDRAARAAASEVEPEADSGAEPEPDDTAADGQPALGARAREADVDRIVDKTRTEMDGAENRRRHSAISHLKAAVAATEAERKRRDGAPPAPPPAVDAQFRDDLSQAIRPRRPVLTGDEAREAAEARPDPLVLGQAQRIDRHLAADAVQPRRVSTRNLLRDDFDPEEEDFDDTTPSTAEAMEASRNFADFAERMGANNLPELLEAAAAYTSAVEGHAWFSRPQILQKVARIADEGDFTREESLRSFGMLLRQGKIQKIRRGQFVIASTSKFMAEARRAQM